MKIFLLLAMIDILTILLAGQKIAISINKKILQHMVGSITG